MMEIVATDGFTLNPGDMSWDEVSALGNLTVYDRTDSVDVIDRCRNADIVIINKTPLDAETFLHLPRLKFITMAATGYDCIDINTAGQRNIPVSNIPVYGTDTVAQYVFSAILHLAHNISIHAEAVQKGEWVTSDDWCFWKRPLIELKGTVIGIVGFGRIGRRVGEVAHAFGMHVLAHDPYQKKSPDYDSFEFCDLDKVFQEADFISVHSPLTEDNHKFVDMTMLSKMKPSAFFINAARGGLVDEVDLSAALSQSILAGAVLDTVSEEPIKPDNPLSNAPNLFITPHMAWGTLAARKRLMSGIAENIEAFLRGEIVNVVNHNLLNKLG